MYEVTVHQSELERSRGNDITAEFSKTPNPVELRIAFPSDEALRLRKTAELGLDDKKVRLENFASLHRGDHTELTAELQAAIKPDNEGYIAYGKVLGTEFSDGMRTGHKHQVKAERHLSNRGTIKKVNDTLVIER